MSRFLFLICFALTEQIVPAATFLLPTGNRALFPPGVEENFFVGTVGKPWMSGTFGCVRSSGWQLHEGLDIRSVHPDKKGEPTDPVSATAAGIAFGIALSGTDQAWIDDVKVEAVNADSPRIGNIPELRRKPEEMEVHKKLLSSYHSKPAAVINADFEQ